MHHLRKFKCAICGCESAVYKTSSKVSGKSKAGDRYCRKCKLIYGKTNCADVVTRMRFIPGFSISKFFSDTVASMSAFDRQRIIEQLGEFPKTYNEQCKLDADRVEQADKDAKNRAISKAHAKHKLSDYGICACCGERFKTCYNSHSGNSKHCAVCVNVFGQAYLKSVDKLSDDEKCELYKIRRANSSAEVKNMTPPELHQNLQPNLNIRLQPANIVVMLLMRAKQKAHELEIEKHKKHRYRCFRCGDTYLLEGEHPKRFICDRCKAYDKEHRKGTKLRRLPGLPSMTYEHLALLPEYAACMFTKHMTAEEIEKLKKIKAKTNPPKRSFSEQLSGM